MAAYAALASLLNTVQDIINHPKISTYFFKKHPHILLNKTSWLLDFVEANNYGEEAEDLEREITSAAQAAEDVIDSHIMNQIYAVRRRRRPLDLIKKIHNMDVVMKKANDFKGKRSSREEQGATFPVAVMDIEETSMVGLDAELKELLYELTRDPKSNRQTISIVGMGGTGKTTLAKNIYENNLIKHHFDFRGWASISQQHKAREILVQLLPESLKKLSSDENINELEEKLHKNLFKRRYLIILDDIWSVEAWNEVMHFFPDNQNGSKIVLTTRLSSVANDCGSSIFMMRLLDEDNSWKLFCKKVFKNESCPPELCEVGKNIVKLCNGLALSIVVTGGLLSKSPRTVEYWNSIVKDIKSISGESLYVLSLSYNHLPAHLKSCFLYMGVFKEDSEIHIPEVVRLWIGEGFIKPSGCRVLEEIGEGYIKDLIDRNLILVRKLHRNGKIKYCGLHDLLRDLCIKLGDQQEFFSMKQAPNLTERRLILQIADFKKDRITRARSILASSLSGQPIKQGLAYGESIGNSIRWELPTFVSLMWNLQYLIIKTHSIDAVVEAPCEIWKMRQLRHVDCKNIYLPPNNRQDQNELLVLENLQTLKTVLNHRLCREVCDIFPNIIRLCLCYNDRFYGYDDGSFECLCNLDRIHKLESLKLEIYDTDFNKKLTFPNSLKKLTLWACGFDWDDMVTIGSLPQLEVLSLRSLYFEGDRWSPIEGQFLRLKFLKLDQIDLVYWDADDSHFPVLEKLVLHLLYHLEEIPLEIGDIATLELIHVEQGDDSVIPALSQEEIISKDRESGLIVPSIGCS